MNCKKFYDRLPDYQDEALSATEQTAARKHFQECGACRLAVARQEAFSRLARYSLSRETQGLSLSVKTRQSILAALKQQELSAMSRRGRLRTFCTTLWRKPGWTGAALLGLLLLIAGGRYHRHSHGFSALHGIGQEAGDIYVIDVPIQTEMHVYRRQNTGVVDTVLAGVSIIDASFPEGFTQPPH